MNSKQRRRARRQIQTRKLPTDLAARALPGRLEVRGEDGETVTAALSTETPVRRAFGYEVLDHGHVDMRRASSSEGLPLIVQHDTEGPLPVGRVRNIRVDPDRVMRGDVAFSRRAEAQAYRQDVIDGIVTDVSLGYDYARTSSGQVDAAHVARRGEQYVFRNWTPYEVSLVSVKADDRAGINRNRGLPTMFDEKKIRALFEAHLKRRGVSDLLKRMIEQESPVEEARGALLDHLSTLEADTGNSGAVDDPGAEGELAIRRAFEPFIAREGVAELQARMLKADTPIAEARTALLDHLGTIGKPASSSATDVRAGDDKADKFNEAAINALTVRALPPSALTQEEKDAIAQNPFASYSCVEMARAWCDVNGIDYRGLSASALIGRAIDPGTANLDTTDFPALLENVMNKALFRGFEQAEITWNKWCSVNTAPDFKAYTRPGVSQFDSYAVVDENNEITEGTVVDKKEGGQVKTYAKALSLTRQALVNDDLAGFADNAMKVGAAGNRTVDEVVYTLLESNPAMVEDTETLFDAVEHGNFVDAGAPPDEAAIIAAKVAMAAQVDQNSILLGIRPRFALSGVALEDTFIKLSTAEYSPNATAGTLTPNTVRNTFVPISSARLSAVPWYMMGPIGTTCEVTFLNGVQAPSLERDEGWSVFAMHWRAWIDFSAIFVDWRAAYKNDGAT